MITQFNFWHIISNKRMAKKDRKIANVLTDLMNKIAKFQGKLKEDKTLGSTERVNTDANELLKLINIEVKKIVDLEDHTAVQDHDLIKHINEVIKALDPNTDQELIQDMQGLAEKVKNVINDARIAAKDIRKDRERMFQYLSPLGMTRVTHLIGNEERQVKKAVKQEQKCEKHILAIKAIMKKMDKPQLVHDKEVELKKYAATFIKQSRTELDNLFHIEFNSAIVTFHIYHEVEDIQNFFAAIQKEGYKGNIGQFNQDIVNIVQTLHSHLTQDYKMMKYVNKEAKKSNRAAKNIAA